MGPPTSLIIQHTKITITKDAQKRSWKLPGALASNENQGMWLLDGMPCVIMKLCLACIPPPSPAWLPLAAHLLHSHTIFVTAEIQH